MNSFQNQDLVIFSSTQHSNRYLLKTNSSRVCILVKIFRAKPSSVNAVLIFGQTLVQAFVHSGGWMDFKLARLNLSIVLVNPFSY